MILRARDDGMTLIELLISVSILALITGPIVLVLQFAFASATSATHRTTDSAGAQLLSAYFPTDVQSAGFVWTPSSTTPFAGSFAYRCGTTNTRLELQYLDATSGAPLAVTYDVVPPAAGDASSDTAFARRTWTADASPCTRVDSTTLLASVDGASLPAATCVPASCASGHSVKLHVDALSKQVHNSSGYTTFAFDLTASKRSG